MRRPGLIALLGVITVMSVGLPAVANTVVVGYLPPGVDYGATDDSEVELGDVQAQGVVVTNLEPGPRDLDTRDECPADGCRYELVVVDPAALRSDGAASPPVACDTLEYAVVDPEPDETSLDGGARVFTGSGTVPRRTADTASETTPAPLTPGVGQLCFVTPSGDDGVTNDAEDGPLAATQPNPVVILHDPDAAADD